MPYILMQICRCFKFYAALLQWGTALQPIVKENPKNQSCRAVEAYHVSWWRITSAENEPAAKDKQVSLKYL